jgi:hypothetical protein
MRKLRKMAYREWIEEHGLSSFTLKCIAIIAMLIDHLEAVVLQNQQWMRFIGRISFPIFCFLLVEGFYHTKNIKKYSFRLLLFSFLSEIPFDLAFHQKVFAFESQNVFFTLFLGLMALILIKKCRYVEIKLAGLCGLMFLAYFLRTDYEHYGIMLIIIFYLFREKIMLKSALLFGVTFGCYGVMHIQSIAGVAALPIALYNGKKGAGMKYFFYIFYPAHFLLLYLVRKIFFV